MDAEFYFRSLTGQPKPVAAPQPLPPPRKLDEVVVAGIIDACERALSASLKMTPAELREAAATKRRGLSVEFDRVLTSGAFGSAYDASSGFTSASVTQQYGFDLTLLSLFSVLADARLPRDAASACAASLGAKLLEAVCAYSPSARRATAATTMRVNAADGGGGGATPASATTPPRATQIVAGMRALLDALRDAGYIAGYTLDDSDVDDGLWAQRNSLSATRLSVSLRDSASLRAAVVLNGRSVSPEVARPLLAAYVTAAGALTADASEYFLDDEYRQNPLEYRPSSQVISLTIAPAGAEK